MNQRTTLDVARDVVAEYDPDKYGRATLTVDEDAGTWRLELVTGGWSENEEFVAGMAEFRSHGLGRWMWWSKCWQSTHRGGLYVFEGKTDQPCI